MSQHTPGKATPGPWRITQLGAKADNNARLFVEALADDAENSLCAEIQTFEKGQVRPVDEANAMLIASAPELLRDLAALVNMLAAEDGAISVSLRPLYRRALDTIAKATQ